MFEIDASVKPIVVGSVLFVLMMFETVRPMFRSFYSLKQRLLHDVSNIALGIFNAILLGFLFVGSVVFVTSWSAEQQIGLLHWLSLTPLAELVLGLVLFDCWQYWWHRLNHVVPFLWRFHAVHHSDAAMNASSAVRFHTVEILYSTLIRLLVLPLIGLSMQHLLIYELILLPIILFHHSNIAVPAALDKLLRVLIVTPRIHWVHHSDVQVETDSNYASLLSVWDRLFKSYRLREDPQNIRLGLGERFEQQAWDRWYGMLKQPFVKGLYK